MYCHVNVLVRRSISLHIRMFYCNYNVNTIKLYIVLSYLIHFEKNKFKTCKNKTFCILYIVTFCVRAEAVKFVKNIRSMLLSCIIWTSYLKTDDEIGNSTDVEGVLANSRADDPTDVEGVLANPRADDPTDVEVVLANPRADDPTDVEGVLADPRADDPTDVDGVLADPRADDPTYVECVLANPRADDQTDVDGVLADPMADDPTYVEGVLANPRADDPTYVEGVLANPRADDPTYVEGVLANPRADDPTYVEGVLANPRQMTVFSNLLQSMVWYSTLAHLSNIKTIIKCVFTNVQTTNMPG